MNVSLGVPCFALIDRVVDIASGAGSRNYFARVSQNDGFRGHIEVDVGTRSDQGFPSDRDVADDNCVRSNPHAILERWRANVFAAARSANRDSLRDIDIGAKNRIGANDDSTEMSNEQTGSDAGVGRDVETVFETVVMIEDSVIDVSEYPDGSFFPAIEGNLSEIVGEAKTGLVNIGG